MKVRAGKALRFCVVVVSRVLWCICDYIFKILEEIGDATGILAIKLIANRLLHWTERLLWLCLIIFSVYEAYTISSRQLRRFIISPTVVSLDRDYRGWKGIMPAVTLCYYDHLDTGKANEYIEMKWNVSIGDEEYFYFMEFLYAIVNASASNFGDLARFADDERFEDVDLGEAIRTIDRSFDQTLMSFNPWYKLSVHPVMTERGRCYAINSPMSAILADTGLSRDADEFEEPLICEFGKQRCFIKMDVLEGTGTIDVHSAYEVSVSETNVIPLGRSEEVIASYKFFETVASDKLRELNPAQRKCVFRDEKVYPLPIYAKTLCLARCRATMALEMCNCVPFFYPYVDGPSCNPAGFDCLLDFKWPVWALHICNCPTTCTENDYTLQSIKRRSWGGRDPANEEELRSTFRWEVSPPKVRMRRDVVFSFEDLLVSYGGTLALFLGFSVLSIIHIVNVLCYNSIRAIWLTVYYSFKFIWKLLFCQIAKWTSRRRTHKPTIQRLKRSRKNKEIPKSTNSTALFAYVD